MTSKQKFKLIIGLGNPDKKYESTYHNVGFLAVDFLAGQPNLSEKSKYFRFLKKDGFVFAKSSVFMNESGKAVAATLKYFNLQPEEILVAHDDSDINLGEFKLSFSRGAAGHHGVESIIKTLKTKDFWRLRIGIRSLKAKSYKLKAKMKAGDFVLKKISPADKKILERVFEKIRLEIENK